MTETQNSLMLWMQLYLFLVYILAARLLSAYESKTQTVLHKPCRFHIYVFSHQDLKGSAVAGDLGKTVAWSTSIRNKSGTI